MRCSRSALVSIYQMWSKEETGRLEEGQGRLTGKPMVIPVHSWAREDQNWTMDQWMKVAWSDESCFLLLPGMAGCVCIAYLVPGCTVGRRQADGSSVMLGNTKSCIYVDVTLTTTHLSIVADHVLPFMETVFPVCCGLLQQLLLVMVHWLCGCLFICGRDISKDMFT